MLSSVRSARPSCSTAAFDAAYGPLMVPLRNAYTDAVSRMCPWLVITCSSAGCTVFHTPRRSTLTTLAKSAGSVARSVEGGLGPMPAFAKTMSSRPNLSTVPATSARIALAFVTSAAAASSCADGMVAVACSSADCEMSVTTTFAPRAAKAVATAPPMPPAPPVTRAVLPFRLSFVAAMSSSPRVRQVDHPAAAG